MRVHIGTTTACGSRADSRLRGWVGRQHRQNRRSGARTLVLRLGRGALAARLLVLDVLDAFLLVLVDEELGAARALPEVCQPQLARVVRDERGPAQARAQVLCARARGGRVVRRLEERALERLERAEAGRRQCAGGHGGRWQEVWRTRLSSPPTSSTRCFSRARSPRTTCVSICGYMKIGLCWPLRRLHAQVLRLTVLVSPPVELPSCGSCARASVGCTGVRHQHRLEEGQK
jgi:hypothetical protein